MEQKVDRQKVDTKGYAEGWNYVPAVPEKKYNNAITIPANMLSIVDNGQAPIAEGVWRPVESKQTRDSVSARDRATASLVDSVPVHMALLMLSGFAAGVFWKIGNAERIDALFVFLGVMGVLTIIYNKDRIKTWMDHSHAGVERLRIVEGSKVAREWKQEEEATKREALRLHIKLLEGDRYDE